MSEMDACLYSATKLLRRKLVSRMTLECPLTVFSLLLWRLIPFKYWHFVRPYLKTVVVVVVVVVVVDFATASHLESGTIQARLSWVFFNRL